MGSNVIGSNQGTSYTNRKEILFYFKPFVQWYFLSLVNKYQKAYVHESLQVLLFVLAIIKNRKIQHLRDDVDEIGR